MFILTYHDFGTGKLASFDNVKIVTIVSLLYDLLARLVRAMPHCTKNDLKLCWVKITEHKGLA